VASNDILLASRNLGKLREIRQVLGDLPVRVSGLDDWGRVEPPEETGRTFAANARDKALYYARATGRWCLADDSGLEVDALDGQPGVMSARYAADQCPQDASRGEIDRANNAKLLAALAGIADERRTARFVCHLALADARRVLIAASGTLEGRIARAPAGDNGFGYDPVFFVSEPGCTVAQLTAEHKNLISHRGKAVRRFKVLLKDFLERA
jgi:XTP/dITP diphosphohydrolase